VLDLVFISAAGVEKCSTIRSGCAAIVHTNEGGNKEHKTEDDDLPDGMTQNVSPHNCCNNSVMTRVGFLVEETHMGWLGGQCKSSKGIHNQVYPQHLD